MCLLQTAARSTQNLFQCAILAGDPDFMDKIVLITGASRGIGAATAQLAARQGWAVAVNYQGNQAAADAVVQQIRAAGGTALAVGGCLFSGLSMPLLKRATKDMQPLAITAGSCFALGIGAFAWAIKAYADERLGARG